MTLDCSSAHTRAHWAICEHLTCIFHVIFIWPLIPGTLPAALPLQLQQHFCSFFYPFLPVNSYSSWSLSAPLKPCRLWTSVMWDWHSSHKESKLPSSVKTFQTKEWKEGRFPDGIEEIYVILTAVRWMTPCEVTGHPMKPTNCNSGQFSATARTDRSVTCRTEQSASLHRRSSASHISRS